MAYNEKQLFEEAKQHIIKNDLVFVDEVIHFLPCSKTTFYTFFFDGSDELNELKELLDKNKVNLKRELRGKWKNSEAPALQLSLYKLMANSDELKSLSMQSIDHTTNGESINIITLGNGIKPETDN
jgi:hypothetical protein